MSIVRFGGIYPASLTFTMDGGLVLGGSFPVSFQVFSDTMSGGLTIGGSFTVGTNYKSTMAGGLVLGGSFIDKTPLHMTVSHTVTFTSAPKQAPFVQQKITFTSTATNNLPYVNNPVSTVYFISRFGVVGGDLATGRYRR